MRPFSLEQRHAPRACGSGSPPCPRAPAPGHNPLDLCTEHLAAYPAARRAPCRRCASVSGVPYLHTAGSMCFACGEDPDGYRCPESIRARARTQMVHRLADMLATARRVGPGRLDAWLSSGKPIRRDELAALLARAPSDVSVRAVRAFSSLLSTETLASVTPVPVQDDQQDRA